MTRSISLIANLGVIVTVPMTTVIPLHAQVNIIATVAGNGGSGASGDGFAATSAGIPSPADVVRDASGNLYISSANRVRRVSPDGTVETLAVVPQSSIAGFSLGSETVTGLSLEEQGNLYGAQTNEFVGGRIIRVSNTGTVTTLTQRGLALDAFGHNGVAVGSDGSLFISDTKNHRVVRRDASGTISTYAGRLNVNAFGGDGGLAVNAALNTPRGLAFDSAGRLYIADSQNHRIRRIEGGLITTVAGSGGPSGGFGGDGGLAVNARLNTPVAVAVDRSGNLYISDRGNLRIRRVDSNGIIATVAGSGVRSNCFGATDECYSGDGGPAISARLSLSIGGLAVDDSGDLYIADTGNNRVRKVTFGASPSQLPRPVIESSGGIGARNAASFQTEITSGSWVTIFGQNLAPIPAPGRIWRGEEIVNGKLPISLEGVSVRFAGKPAFVYFVHPTQLNVLAPDDLSTGIVSVEVVTPSGTAQSNAQVRQFAPALFRTVSGPAGTVYAAAVHQDGTIVGPPSLIPGARPARAGDIVSIFGTGFGLTSPMRPAGDLFDPAPLAVGYTVRLDDTRVQSNFGGIVGPGLYQFNLLVPAVNTTAGFMNVDVEVGGQRSDLRTILAVQR